MTAVLGLGELGCRPERRTEEGGKRAFVISEKKIMVECRVYVRF